ncbi:MAG: MBL fold metallo-hydrolase [Bradymonadia bacterium]
MSIVIHDIICGSFCPRGASLQSLFPTQVVSHCLLVESNAGLVLIDTGVGRVLNQNPSAYLGHMNHFIYGMDRPSSVFTSALEHVERLGYRAQDVRHIIPTHLDFDHCGDLSDFPEATIHVFERELVRAKNPSSLMDKQRYLAHALAHNPKYALYQQPSGEPWFGFDTVRSLQGVSDDILLIPLFGHTVGHTGVAVKGPNGWVLHAGDAYYQRVHLFERMSMMARLIRRRIDDDPEAAITNQKRLTTLIESDADVRVFCSHDPLECPGHSVPS